MSEINNNYNPYVPNQNVPSQGIDGVYNVPYTNVPSANVPNINTGVIGVDPIGNQYVQINGIWVRTPKVSNVQIAELADRSWLDNPPQAVPKVVPVTIQAGTPIVDMPGCVKVHKENVKQQSKNKMLVNDDPEGNTVLCDAGAPFYEPADYDYKDLSWETIYTETDQEAGGIDTGGDVPAPDIDPPSPPKTPPQTAEEIECPPANARRIGDLNQAGTEKVTGYKLSPDKLTCITEWEELSFTEQYLPSVPIVSTTATIAVVATSSALLAKPLADLLLKVIKPVVKKVLAKVDKIRGKKEKVLSVRERLLAQRDRNRAVMELRKALKK